jgi:KRAB domain-containing zinc finger protein
MNIIHMGKPSEVMQIHVKSDVRKKAYMGKQCGKSFTFPSVPEFHERTSSGEKPYVCKQCGKAFSFLNTV